MLRITRTLPMLLCIAVLSSFACAAPPVVPPAANAPKPGVNTPQVQKINPYARIVIDSIYCQKESKWDHGTSQDEPYLMAVGFASHRDPGSWTTGKPEVFKDVDSGNNRRFTKQERVVFEGTVPENAVVGFEAVLWEKDESSENAVMKVAEKVAWSIHEWISSDDHDLKKEMPRLMAALWPYLVSSGIYLVGGGADDKIAETQVLITADDLRAWAAEEPSHKAFRVELNGGDEGQYWLRYHIEFQPDSVREYPIEFTEWDDIAAGNLDRQAGDEFVVVAEGKGADGSGRFNVYHGDGRLARSFDAPYARFDRVAIGNIMGRETSQILVASLQGGGLIRVYDAMGNLHDRFNIPFTKYDGFAVADVVGDEKAEIIIANDDQKKVFIYGSDGKKIDEFGLNWPFKGARYTGSDTRHDAFLVGDVVGDSKAEIVMIENKDGPESVLRVYNGRGSEAVASAVLGKLRSGFHNFSAAALGDLHGDAKKELILATTDDQGIHTNTMYVIDIAAGKRVGMRHGPWFSKYDGFAAGKCSVAAKDQIIVAGRADRKVYVSR